MKPAGDPFWKDIQGLRAIAVLGVMFFHSGVPYLQGGYVGVDVFYVISGYLITGLMLRDSSQSPKAFLAAFYARRIRRILPAATVVIVASLLGAAVVQHVLENSRVGGDALSSALFYSNIHFESRASDYFAAGLTTSPFQQYWSLSLEEQFYFCWPLLFLFLRRFGARAIVGSLFLLCAASFALSILWMKSRPIAAFYSLPPRAWELGVGAIIAAGSGELVRIQARLRAILGYIGAVAIVAPMIVYTGGTAFPGVGALPPTIGTGLVILAGLGESNWLGYRALSVPPLQLIGRYSFSLYLWHWPLLVLKVEHFKFLYRTWPIRTGFMFVVTAAAALITFHLVEDRLRRSPYFRTRINRTFALGLGTIVIALLAIVGFERLANRGALSSSREVAATGGRPALPISATEFVPKNLQPRLDDTFSRNYLDCEFPCVAGARSAKERVVLFGDSHAFHWSGALDSALKELGFQFELRYRGGCASYDISVDLLPTLEKGSCEALRSEAVASFMRQPPALIVLSNLTDGVFEKHPDEWERGVRETLRRFSTISHVVVFSETPRSAVSIPLCLASNLERTARCDVAWPVKLNEKLRTIANEEGASFVDLSPLFCTKGRCPAITEDMLIYTDTDHVSVAYAAARASWMRQTLATLIHR